MHSFNPLELQVGQFVGYVDDVKPRPVAIEGLQLRWHIVETEPQREARAVESIRELGLKPYFPVLHKRIPAGRRRAREITTGIFPSRIFVPMPTTNEALSRVLSSRGVHGFMKTDGLKPATLSDTAIEEIRRTEGRVDAKYQRKLAAAEASPYRRGRQVWAEIFPTQKMLARIEDLDAKGRINVLLEIEIMGRKVWPVKPHLLQFVEV